MRRLVSACALALVLTACTIAPAARSQPPQTVQSSAVAKTFDQVHPVFALVRRSVLPHLTEFLIGGGRKIDAWYATLSVVEVAFDDEADAFRNINTRDELNQAGTHG